MSSRSIRQASVLRHSALAIALAIGMGGTGAVLAQSTAGYLFGTAQPGDTVEVKSGGGINREVPVDANGRFRLDNLPVGSAYEINLKRDGAVVDSRKNVNLTVGKGTDVSFAAAAATAASAQSLESVTVTANSLPPVDVSSVDSRTVITSEQLAKLPLGRTAEAIALLAPGAVSGSGYFTGPTGNALVSIGGGSVTENAYYINGFNTTDPISGFGGIALPYGAIDQQEVLAGGYGAAYGRSAGGVISQVGKRGTNEWHFGAQVLWEPRGTRSTSGNDHYQVNSDTASAGELFNYNKKDNQMREVESAYVGGPLIKDKLYIFLAAEQEKVDQDRVTSQDAPAFYDRSYRNPKYYGKLDWNINDSNILEGTYASNKQNYDANVYDFDYNTLTKGALEGKDTSQNTKSGAELYSFKYTSYITDDLTLTATYGKMKGTYYTPAPDSVNPHVINPQNQDPTIVGGNPITNDNPASQINNPQHKSTNRNLRIDLSYHAGDHTITGGIDNQDVKDIDDGVTTSGPGYAWEYGKKNAGQNIAGAPGSDTYVGPGNAQGYYVDKYIYQATASVRVKQRAQYLEDSWQVSDRWLVKVGIRNDQFTNYNGVGQPYLKLTSPQWAPRLGATWDVNGDSSLKIYANAGRYYLALPASVALRSAGQSLYTRQYFTYTGIDALGQPTGLAPIDTATGGPISANREYGVPRDPNTATSRSLKSEYQDEFIAGFDKTLGDKWVYGAKATVRKLKNAIDDVGDSDTIENALIRQGVDPATIGTIQGSYLFNPGRASDFLVPNTNGGYYTAHVTNADFGFPHLKRNYYALEMYLEHPFDGKWYGKVDYLYSKSYGNSEGQVRSDIGQTDVSATVDWDFPSLMVYSNGELSNSRRHTVKAYGSYQLTDEFLLSGNITMQSGAPKDCLGLFGSDESDPTQYGSYYHFCYGQPSPPGKQGHLPWTYLVDLSAEYRPMWADKKLAFSISVFNVLNKRDPLSIYPQAGGTDSVDPDYKTTLFQTTPRYARFGISYDF